MIVNSSLAKSTGCDQKDLWQTPDHVFDKLNRMFGFTLDPCCTHETALCERYFTPEDNGLIQSWSGNISFVNPPYSRGNIDLWVEKCWNESRIKPGLVVGLLPVSTSSDWWHNYIVGRSALHFVNKRIRFKGAKYTAPFSSVIVVWGENGIYSFNQYT